MEKYRTEKDGKQITIWNDTEEIGLRFMEGEPQQRYTASIVVADPTAITTAEALENVTRTQDNLTRYAEEQYPKEFAPLAS